MTLRIAVDFDGNDWAGLYCDASDAPNLFAGTGVNIADLYHRVNGAGTSETDSAHSLYGDDRAKYGKRYFTFVTSTSANPFIDIGYDGATYNLTGQTAGTYSFTLWAKLASGSAADTFAAKIFSSGGDVAQSTSAALNSATWTKFTGSGSWAGAARSLGLRLFRDSGTTALNVQVTGAMILNGSTVPAYFNCGAGSILLEPVTGYANDADWALGFVRPYQQIAPLGKVDITLVNGDRRFSPEYASSPLTGTLVPGRLVQIGDPDHGIWGTYWTENWMPLPGTSGEQTCKLSAVDARRFAEELPPHVELFEQGAGPSPASTWAGSMITVILAETGLPGSVNTYGTGGYTYNLFSLPADPSFQTESPLYYGDSNPEGATALNIIADILGAWQSHLWFDRAGGYVLLTSAGDSGTPNAINQDWLLGSAQYDIEKIINKVDVTVHPKRRSSGTVTLWELDEDITLAAGETETIRVNFRNLSSGTNGDKTIVGANDLATSGFTLAVGSVPTNVTVTISEERAQSCVLTIVNISGISRTVNAGSITGRKIIALRTYVKSYEDATSIAAYGVKAAQLNFEWVSTRPFAKRLGKWLVSRFKDPQYVMRRVTLSVDNDPALAFACYTGSRVTIEDDQTDHSDTYTVIGEAHKARAGLKDHTVTLYLQPEYATTILGTSI